MEQLQVFESLAFGKLRILELDNVIWFVGADVGKALGYTNPRKAIKDHVDPDDTSRNETLRVNGKLVTLINESGLYSLILTSKLPKAREFKRWITKEVIPSIRKHGGYIVGQETMTDAELLARALLVAQNIVKDRDVKLNQLKRENGDLSQKARYFDRLVERNTLSTLRETAYKVGLRQSEFIRFLISERYVYRGPDRKLKIIEPKSKGLLVLKNSNQILVTPKGVETFRLMVEIWELKDGKEI